MRKGGSGPTSQVLTIARTRRPLDIDRVAWLLIRKFGPCAAHEALNRMAYCAEYIDNQSATEWSLVAEKIQIFQCVCVPIVTH
jgi:hypothetical protein